MLYPSSGVRAFMPALHPSVRPIQASSGVRAFMSATSPLSHSVRDVFPTAPPPLSRASLELHIAVLNILRFLQHNSIVLIVLCADIHARPAALYAPDTGFVQCACIHVRHEPFSRSERYGFPAAPPSHSHALRELYFAVLNYLRIFAA